MGEAGRLRRLRSVYATGTVLWTLCLLLTVAQGSASPRQVVFILLMPAAFLALVLWATWRLWHIPDTATPRADRTAPSDAAA